MGIVSSTAADDPPQVRGMPPRLVIASGIDAEGNLLLSGTEQRKKTMPRQLDKDGKKITVDVTVSYPVTVLGRQSVALKDVTIYDGEGKTISLDQARQRLKEPTPVFLMMMGEKLDPIYQQVMKKEMLTFVFPWFAELKDLTTAKREGGIAVGAKVPDFAVKTLDGKTVKLSDLQKDKRTKQGVVVLSFWCSTCSSCRRVEQHLDKLAQDYAGQALVLALDANAGETADAVSAFAKEKGLTLPIVLDPGGQVADLLGNEVTTTTVVIDGSGVLRYFGRFRDGERAYAEAALKEVLAGQEVRVKTTVPDG
jgi:thiol-disulfide isomerase/thioredoxin